ncbi:MAG TPA: terpene cyclase/mutase family protein [Phycisphaerae bacterium]|nr:terpene cyclase/mutase family protein [Phycisphaerae bacterium]HRY68821.1 terpene cyclase/mutase family protein [Phycisphaerae bacterium]HSA27485.1 terpene cyclase/mutase family protein [Phycisphaerae bacterium]
MNPALPPGRCRAESGASASRRCFHRRPALRTVAAVVAVLTPIAPAELPPPLPPLVTPETQKAIDRGLEYLARTQSREGSWRDQGSMGQFPVAMTALAAMALLANGNTPTEGKYAVQVNSATKFLLRCQDQDGLISRVEEESRSMYGHGFSMLFLGQVYGMEASTETRDRISQVLRNAVTLTSRSQSTLGGWLYTPDSRSDEGSVTITQLQGLRSVRNAGLAVPKKTIDKALGYLEKSWLPDGGITYRADRLGGARPPITAAAVACWYNAGQYENAMAKKSLAFVKQSIGRGGQRGGSWGHYYYAHLYMAQVMWLSGEADWQWYFPSMRDWLLAAQGPDGSWDGDYVGKVYGTSIALIILQMPYGYLPILQR